MQEVTVGSMLFGLGLKILLVLQQAVVNAMECPEASHGSILQSDMILSYMQLYQQDCGAPLHRGLQKFRFPAKNIPPHHHHQHFLIRLDLEAGTKKEGNSFFKMPYNYVYIYNVTSLL
ncbi:uncharacterized protein LOC111442906 [Cucurbita moschata]|uniref:Uncharacterized protein LOC111442906 n=1 Tax=Cucurbita moschata TaxID=3662 RepID=A0A6J1F7R0_CUCMO|nr:uncharacterized protein LOC111442906 [Cucurbita moschata]